MEPRRMWCQLGLELRSVFLPSHWKPLKYCPPNSLFETNLPVSLLHTCLDVLQIVPPSPSLSLYSIFHFIKALAGCSHSVLSTPAIQQANLVLRVSEVSLPFNVYLFAASSCTEAAHLAQEGEALVSSYLHKHHKVQGQWKMQSEKYFSHWFSDLRFGFSKGRTICCARNIQ